MSQYSGINKSDYLEKLKDPRWQKKRLEVFNDCDFTCGKCGDTKKTLHVHHRYYEQGKEPWEYDEEALICLCESCHTKETNEIKEAIARITKSLKRKFFAEDLVRLADILDDGDIGYSSSLFLESVEYFTFPYRDIKNPRNLWLIVEAFLAEIDPEENPSKSMLIRENEARKKVSIGEKGKK